MIEDVKKISINLTFLKIFFIVKPKIINTKKEITVTENCKFISLLEKGLRYAFIICESG